MARWEKDVKTKGLNLKVRAHALLLSTCCDCTSTRPRIDYCLLFLETRKRIKKIEFFLYIFQSAMDELHDITNRVSFIRDRLINQLLHKCVCVSYIVQ